MGSQDKSPLPGALVFYDVAGCMCNTRVGQRMQKSVGKLKHETHETQSPDLVSGHY